MGSYDFTFIFFWLWSRCSVNINANEARQITSRRLQASPFERLYGNADEKRKSRADLAAKIYESERKTHTFTPAMTKRSPRHLRSEEGCTAQVKSEERGEDGGGGTFTKPSSALARFRLRQAERAKERGEAEGGG